MKRPIIILILALVLFTFVGCATVSFPMSVGSAAVGSKTGQASGVTYFGFLFGSADASILTAAKNGGITRIATVDLQVKHIAGIVWTFTTTVTGE